MAVNRSSSARRPAAVRGVERALAAPEARLDALRGQRAREHEALLRAARKVFIARGYAQARVEDILREAGLSTRAFYRFHASKDQLFLELFSRANEAALGRLARTVGRRKSAPAKLEAYVAATLELAYDPRYRGETRLFATVPGELAERHAREVVQCRAGLASLLREIVDEGVASGDFPDAHPEDDAWSLHGALGGALERVLWADPPPERRALLRHLLRFCQSALASGGKCSRAGSRASA
jgi:AcrR family transcriptional regulator